jgi:uncharacterized DUF497 family protein
MNVTGVIWLEEIVDKLQRKHDVTTEEVEEALTSKARIRRLESGHVEGEDLYAASGRTRSGRYLMVFFVYKTTHQALIISAREMTDKERRLHGKK